ncbi:MAG: hypothetical protein A2Z18_04160 [Armatimonadetes bacterium RBG_16_58_9]|nr:MAG: hypothetical protein A2Z18_04160 [Armatimonadetes bacterium RBG_16_58_9]
MLLFGIPRADLEKTTYALPMPGMLSFVATGRFDGEVRGLKSFPRDEWPPIALTFYPFHLMVVIGMFLIAFPALGLLLLILRRLPDNRAFLWIAVLAIPLPFLANELGWMAAECGRQPWVVYGILRTADAVSPTARAGQILFTIIMFSLIYIVLFAAWVFVLRQLFRRGLGDLPETGKETVY